jgi:hypothetical protein
MDMSRRMDNGLRAHYEPRRIESWPSTGVRYLPSSNRVKDNWGRVHTRLGIEPLSLEMPQTYSRLEERLTVESPRREASSPRILPHGTEIHTTTLWHLWRAPPRTLADPYRMGHRLPLEFPANSSPEIVTTRPSRVVRRSPPLLLS